MRIETCINYLLTVSQHEVFQLLSDQLSPYDITPSQYRVLNYLWENSHASPKELAQVLSLKNSTISGMLDCMQKKGLIDRLLGSDDRRSIKVVLTPEGVAMETNVLRVINKVNNQVLGKFDSPTADTLLCCLRKIGGVQ